MKTATILILLLLFANGCAPKPKDEAVIAFVDTLRKFPEAGMMPWENGISGVLNTKSNDPEEVISYILTGFKMHKIIGPITEIEKKEFDLHDTIYGVQTIRTDTMHKVPEPPVKTIILIYKVKVGAEHWAWRDYDLPAIQKIQESVSEGIAKRTKK